MRGGWYRNVRPLLIPGCVVVFIALYIALDSMFLRVFPGQRLFYAGTFVISMGVAILGLSRLAILTRESVMLLLWVFLNVLWFLAAFGQQPVYLQWVIGDAVTLILPMALVIAASSYSQLYTSKTLLMLFFGLLLVSAVLGAVLGIGPNSRFESPATLLFPVCWLLFATSRGASKIIPAVLLLVLALLAIGAGERTSMILWLFSGLVIFGMKLSTRQLVGASFVGLVLLSIFGATLFQAGLRDAIGQTRFKANLDGEVDSSILTRFNEASDVLREFRHANPVVKLIGHGHGAAYRPVDSLTLQNITDDGYVHHVHIGPALVIYRYGLLGFFVLVWIWWRVVKSLLKMHGMPIAHWNFVHVAFTLALLMYLIDFFLRNVMADPAFSYIIAGYLFLESRGVGFRSRSLPLTKATSS